MRNPFGKKPVPLLAREIYYAEHGAEFIEQLRNLGSHETTIEHALGVQRDLSRRLAAERRAATRSHPRTGVTD